MSNKKTPDFLLAQVYVGLDPPPHPYPASTKEGIEEQSINTRKVFKRLPLTPHWSAHKERLKEKKGTRQTQASPVYQKHRLLKIKE